MAKKQQQMANAAAETATGTATGYGAGASDIGAQLVPFEERQLTHPTGESPTDTNAELVAGEQGAGGATGSLASEATNRAARARNTGALSGTLDEIARAKTRQLSQNALNVQAQNARTKLGQQSEAAKVLGGLYGTDVNAQLRAEGLVPEDINAAIKAGSAPGWLDTTMGVMDTLNRGALTGAKIAGVPGA